MENNPYDLSLPWIPRQDQTAEVPGPGAILLSPQQLHERSAYTTNSGEFKQQLPKRSNQSQPASSTSTRMPKAQALALVRSLKKYLIIGSVVAFGILGGLAAKHATGVSASQIPQTPALNAPSSPAPFDSGGFFDHRGGGYGFGSNSSPSGPVSGSSVS